MRGLIIEEVCKLTIPVIQIIGVYVVLFGHISPGGGFAGGTIIAISLILSNIILSKEVASAKTFINIQVIALIMYVLIKGVNIIDANMHLNITNIDIGTPGNIMSGGFIFPLNIIVSIVVCTSIYSLFNLFYRGEI